MFGYNWDFDRRSTLMDQLLRRMDRALEDFDTGQSFTTEPPLPRVNVHDAGSALVFSAEVPGFGDDDVNITLTQDVLTLSGKRKPEQFEGYSLQRRERLALDFSRSFALPVRVDPDKASASVKDGILTVRLEKAAEVKPRTISVRPS
jgi:HSP20 family protein